MEPSCVRHTDLPHTSRLFTDFTYRFPRVASFYPHWPGDPESYAASAAELDYPEDRRAALVEALRGQNEWTPALELISQPGTVAVVTGQQVGLFSGPAYTIYKALTAVKLARQLSDRGIPAVPVFWLATEDHDFAEVNHCWIFNSSHDPVSLSVNGRTASQQPVGNITLPTIPLEAMQQALENFPFGKEVAGLVGETYPAGVTLGTGFRDLIRRLLHQYGLLYLDPLDASVRKIAAPLLRRAVEAAPEIKELLLKRNEELTSAGYHAQVHVEQETGLFFLLDGDRRVALRRQNGEYASKDRRYSSQELMDLAEHVSPNALLRPVVQDYLLPTVAYVGGPAELAYMAQAEVIYKRLLGRMPVALSRSGFTLLDAKSLKLTERYSLQLSNFFHGEEALREKISRSLVPPSLGSEFEKAKSEAARSLDQLGAEIHRFDPTLSDAMEKSRAKMLYQLSKIERKTAREALRRNTRVAEDARFLLHLIYPHKHLQERFYSILPFLAKHGFDLIDRLYENIHLECPDHLIYTI